MSGVVGSIALGSLAKRAGGVAKVVPPKVWLVIGLIAALLIGWWVHGNKVDAYGKERYGLGYAAGYAEALKDAAKLQRQAEQISADISSKLKGQNDETLRAIARLGDDLRLRGPGKAICAYPSAAGTGPGGPQQAGGSGDAAVDQVPDRERVDLIGLPFADAIAFAEQHDANRTEVLTWRKNDALQRQSRGTKP